MTVKPVRSTHSPGLSEHRKVRDKAAGWLVQKKARWIGARKLCALSSANSHRQAHGRRIADGSKRSTEPYRCSAHSSEDEVDSQESGILERLDMALLVATVSNINPKKL